MPPSPQPLPGVDSIIAVGSGKGGVGKTTIAVNLALALQRMGHKVGVLDADVYGPNVPLMLNARETPRVVGDNRIQPLEPFGVKLISVGLLNVTGADYKLNPLNAYAELPRKRVLAARVRLRF